MDRGRNRERQTERKGEKLRKTDGDKYTMVTKIATLFFIFMSGTRLKFES